MRFSYFHQPNLGDVIADLRIVQERGEKAVFEVFRNYAKLYADTNRAIRTGIGKRGFKLKESTKKTMESGLERHKAIVQKHRVQLKFLARIGMIGPRKNRRLEGMDKLLRELFDDFNSGLKALETEKRKPQTPTLPRWIVDSMEKTNRLCDSMELKIATLKRENEELRRRAGKPSAPRRLVRPESREAAKTFRVLPGGRTM